MHNVLSKKERTAVVMAYDKALEEMFETDISYLERGPDPGGGAFMMLCKNQA